MRQIVSAALGVVIGISCVAVSAAAQGALPARELRLTFETDGTVSLSAAGVSVREVFAEWARLCGCLVANANNLTGSLDVPVRFDHVPQQTVLASLLRKSAGYILTPRSANMTGPSQFETVYVLATSNPVSTPAPYSPPVSYTPVPAPTFGSPADEIPPVTPIPTLPGRTPAVPGAAQTPVVNSPQGVMNPFAPAPSSGGSPPVQTPGVPGPTQSSPNAPQPQAPMPAVPGSPSRFVPIVPVTPEAQRPAGAAPSPNTPGAQPTRP